MVWSGSARPRVRPTSLAVRRRPKTSNARHSLRFHSSCSRPCRAYSTSTPVGRVCPSHRRRCLARKAGQITARWAYRSGRSAAWGGSGAPQRAPAVSRRWSPPPPRPVLPVCCPAAARQSLRQTGAGSGGLTGLLVSRHCDSRAPPDQGTPRDKVMLQGKPGIRRRAPRHALLQLPGRRASM